MARIWQQKIACMGSWDLTNYKNFFQGSGGNGGMVTLGDINPLYILFYFKKMLRNFIEHVWKLIVPYYFLATWLADYQTRVIYLFTT